MVEFSQPKKSYKDGSQDGIKYGLQSLRSLLAGEIFEEMFFRAVIIRLISMIFSTETNIMSIISIGFYKLTFPSVEILFSTSFVIVSFIPICLRQSFPCMEAQ